MEVARSHLVEKMMQRELCSSRVLTSFREECGEEELSVLPRHTKVIVTGNNRTKSVLVGLQGVVKKAVGLGGWHWLVLKNGIEVKLQRNALSVLEPPTGNEVDDDEDFDNSSSGSDLGAKGNFFTAGFMSQRPSKLRVRRTKPWDYTGSAKTPSGSFYEAIECNIQAPQLKVNFRKLGMNSLWRYCKHFNLGIVHNPSKERMVKAVQLHFVSQQVDEHEVIMNLICSAKRLRKVEGGH
uniref:Histone deacetylase complex subunit SAP30 Sin3 binding domain-containing protein n=1 Tax=Kalanchoe fedtschenkoi TaxID=63787 RepID=A0A7N0VGF7_KALFE